MVAHKIVHYMLFVHGAQVLAIERLEVWGVGVALEEDASVTVRGDTIVDADDGRGALHIHVHRPESVLLVVEQGRLAVAVYLECTYVAGQVVHIVVGERCDYSIPSTALFYVNDLYHIDL